MHETASGALLVVDELGRMGRSTDGGDTWATVDLAGVNGFSNAGGETLAATDAGIYRSTDDGASWPLLAVGPSALHSVARADDTTLVATGPLMGQWQRTVYQSPDNGATWRSLGSEGASPAIRAQDGRVYYSNGVGSTPFGYPNRHLILRWEAGVWEQVSTSEDRITGFYGGLDAVGSRVFFATFGQSISNTDIGGLHVRGTDSWDRYGNQASALLVRSEADWLVGGFGVVDRYSQTRAGIVVVERIELGGRAPITTLVGSGDLFSSGATFCEETLDGVPGCDEPGVPVRITLGDLGAGGTTTRPIGFGQSRVRLVVNDGDDVLALTDRGIWQLETACSDCLIQWTQISATAPLRADLIFDLARTRWGAIYASAQGLHWPSLFVQTETDGEWSSAVNFASIPVFVAALDDTTLLLGSETGLSRSTDQGETFDIVLDTPIRSLYKEHSSGVLVGTDDGLLVPSGNSDAWPMLYDTSDLGPVYAAAPFLAGDFASFSLLAGRTVLLAEARQGEALPDSVEPSGSRFISQLPSWLVTERAVWRPSFADTLEQIYASPKREPCSFAFEKCAFPRLSGASTVNGRDISVFLSTPTGLLRTLESLAVNADAPLQPETATLNVTPNPVAGRAVIALPLGTHRVDVYDAMGRRVAQIEVPGSASDVTWDADGVAPGLYFVRTETPSGPVSRAIVVAR